LTEKCSNPTLFLLFRRIRQLNLRASYVNMVNYIIGDKNEAQRLHFSTIYDLRRSQRLLSALKTGKFVSENSTSATLRGHFSNSRAVVPQ